jgi:hypothetical protein
MCHCPDDARTVFALFGRGIHQSLSETPWITRPSRVPDIESRDPRILHVYLQTPFVIET